MVIEVLFGESCNLYGDGENISYLQATLPEAEFIHTKLTDTPYFADHDPDIIYIGSMSESIQRRVIDKLLPYRDKLLYLIERGTPILATGNAGEIFCSKISYVTENIEKDGINVFDMTVKTDLFDRYNGKVLARLEDMDIVGFRSQFSMIYGDNSESYFVKCQKGIGINRSSDLEGLRKNNLICTQIIGPILPLNPLFCEYFISLCGVHIRAAHRDVAMSAYAQHLTEFKDPTVNF